MRRLEQAAQGGNDPDTMAVVVAPDKTILVGENFIIHPTSIEIVGQIDRAKWVGFMKWVHSLEGTIQWGLGDMVNVADEHRDEWLSDIEGDEEPDSKYEALLEESGYSYSSLRKFASFANRFPVFRRRNTISYSHHVEVVDLPAEQGDSFLDQAEAKGWSVRELRKQIQESKLPAEAGHGDNTTIAPAVDAPALSEDEEEATPLFDDYDVTDPVHEKRFIGFRKRAAQNRYAEIDMLEIDEAEKWLAFLRKKVAQAKVEADRQARMRKK